MHVDNGDIQGQGAESQQSRHHCSGQQCCPAAQGTEVDERLHDKGLVDAKEHQEEDCWPESVVQVVACYHPHLGRCDDVMDQTDVGVNAHLDVFPVKLNAPSSNPEGDAAGHNELGGGPAQGSNHDLVFPLAGIPGHDKV